MRYFKSFWTTLIVYLDHAKKIKTEKDQVHKVVLGDWLRCQVSVNVTQTSQAGFSPPALG